MTKAILLRRRGSGDLLVEDTYVGDTHSMTREYGLTPNGNQLGGFWVLRDQDGTFLDYDQYRIDLAARHGFTLGD